MNRKLWCLMTTFYKQPKSPCTTPLSEKGNLGITTSRHTWAFRLRNFSLSTFVQQSARKLVKRTFQPSIGINCKIADQMKSQNFLLKHISTEVRFSSFLSSGFTTVAVINSPVKKLANPTSVQSHCCVFISRILY